MNAWFRYFNYCILLAIGLGNLHAKENVFDANTYVSWLGLPFSEKPFQALKSQFGAAPPEIDYEEATAFWSFYDDLGIDFIFADEAIFTDREARDIGIGEFFLTDVIFYGTTDCHYFHNAHALPFGVKYGDDFAAVVNRLNSVGGQHKITDKTGENWWAFTRKTDSKRYGVSFTFDEVVGVTEAKIQYYFGQDHMDWMLK